MFRIGGGENDWPDNQKYSILSSVSCLGWKTESLITATLLLYLVSPWQIIKNIKKQIHMSASEPNVVHRDSARNCGISFCFEWLKIETSSIFMNQRSVGLHPSLQCTFGVCNGVNATADILQRCVWWAFLHDLFTVYYTQPNLTLIYVMSCFQMWVN